MGLEEALVEDYQDASGLAVARKEVGQGSALVGKCMTARMDAMTPRDTD